MLRRCFLQVGVLIFAAAAPALSMQPVLSVQPVFNIDARLEGRYSFTFNKWTIDDTIHQFAMVGVMTFDGAGNVTGSGTAVGAGVLEDWTLGGTYTVGPNGTGEIDFTSPPSNSAFRTLFVLNSISGGLAHGIQFMNPGNNNNVVNSGTASLLTPTAEPYSAASLQGSFSFLSNSWSADPDFDEQGGLGIITFDGKGNVMGSFNSVDNGVGSTLSFTGTYAVNPDGTCSASVTLSDSTIVNYACALNSVGPLGANGVNLVVTNPGPSGTDDSTNYAVTVNAVKQNTP